MARPSTRRLPLLLALALVVVVGCASGGYRPANQAIVDELPVPDVVSSFEVEHYDFCSRDTCLTGNDRSGALLTYAVDADDSIEAQRALIDEFAAALAGWEASVEEGCANADESFCDEIVWASFERGDALVTVNLDNWPAGFESHVDARGAAAD